MSKIFFILIFIILVLPLHLFAQKDTIHLSPISAFITLDSFVVTATKKGFNVDDFIDLVRNDESFFRAFHNLRFTDVKFTNDIKMYNKKGQIKASYQSTSTQYSDGTCRTMANANETTTGNFFKRQRKYKYYTAKLYDRVFFTHSKTCEDPNATTWQEGKKGIEKHISELKKLIFSPGEKANVPLIGNKTAIFEQEMLPFYNYSISSKKYIDGSDCYVFTAKVKPEFQERKTNKTKIRE